MLNLTYILKWRSYYSANHLNSECYASFLENKVGRRIGAINRETNAAKQPTTRRYLAGLSLGPSSSMLVKILDSTSKSYSSKKGNSALEPQAVYVDSSLTEASGNVESVLNQFREEFKNVGFESVCLSRVLEVDTVDWKSLGLEERPKAADDHKQTLRNLLRKLPSATSRNDVMKILVKHLLMHLTAIGGYHGLMLGHSTTALAASTLTEVANGRGFSVPFLVNDGPLTLVRHGENGHDEPQGKPDIQVAVYYPMREVFKNEIKEYIKMLPPLAALIPEGFNQTSNVVSHKDVSIEEIMNRYFESVEGPYSGIVANVVKTSGKLDKVRLSDSCGLCGMTRDQVGDSTWAGEVGNDEEESIAQRLCYGCARSLKG